LLLKQELIEIKVRQRLALIIAKKLVKKEFTKTLKGLTGVIIK